MSEVRYEWRALAGTAPMRRCAQPTHGRHCAVPWGWDPDHSDQLEPYTVDQLAQRVNCPHRWAYPSTGAYLHGHALWRALRRDGRLSPAESQARLDAAAISAFMSAAQRLRAWLEEL